MRRIPGLRFGLAQRTMLLLVAVVFGSLAVLAAGFAVQRRDDQTDFLDAQARGIAAQVHSARLMLLSVPAQFRRGVSEGLRESGTVQLFPAGETAPPEPGSSASQPAPRRGLFGATPADLPDVSEAVARYATQPAQVRHVSGPASSYWVSQVIDSEKWWIVVHAGGPPPMPGDVPWLMVAAVLFGLLCVAALYATSITRPLRRLAVATHRVGDDWPDPVDVGGPAELRDLADSFNAMLVRLRQVEDERRVLLGGLPHDLRAPLTRLRLRVESLTEPGTHAGMIEDIAAIDRIVRQFTAYLRGVQPGEPRQPLDELMRAAVDAYRSLGLDVSVDGDAVPVSLPQFAARRLLDNLIENAVQHGSEPVRVSVRAVVPGFVELAVTDHGAGIPAEVAETALEPFTKLDPARGHGGCGLGLAIVRQLARQLGGGVRFEKGDGIFSVVVRLGVQ